MLPRVSEERVRCPFVCNKEVRWGLWVKGGLNRWVLGVKFSISGSQLTKSRTPVTHLSTPDAEAETKQRQTFFGIRIKIPRSLNSSPPPA